MSELPDLPRDPRRVRPLRPGGLDAAVRVGRHRRNRFVGAAAGTVVAVVVVATAVLSGPGEALDILQPATEPGAPVRGGVTSPTPASSHGSAQHPTNASAQGLVRQSAASPTAAIATASPLPDASALLPVRSTPTPVSRHGHGYVEAPADVAAPAACQQPPSGSTGPVFYGGASGCSSGSGGPSQVKRGGTVRGTADMCVARGGKAVKLGYDDGQEHEVLVTNSSGELMYRFSTTVTFTQGAHSRTVGDGRCLEWTGTWDTRTTSGALVPPGRYQVTVSLLPDTVNGQRNDPNTGGSTGFSVDVQ